MATVARAIARAGDVQRAESIARSIDARYPRALALAVVAETAAEAGDADRAEKAIDAIGVPLFQVRALCSVARATAGAARVRAGALADRAETIARALPGRHRMAQALAYVARAVAELGDPARAGSLLDEAATLPELVGESGKVPVRRAEACAAVARAFARLAAAQFAAGDRTTAGTAADRAEAVAGIIDDPASRAAALTRVAGLLAAGDVDRAIQLAGSLDSAARRARALAAVATTIAASGNRAQAAAVVRSAPSVEDPTARWGAAVTLARAAAEACDLEYAEALACSVSDPHYRVRAMAEVAWPAAEAGEWSRLRRWPTRRSRLPGPSPTRRITTTRWLRWPSPPRRAAPR